MTIEWVCKHHSDLGKEQLYAILQLRTAVFVVEQRCPYQEVDGQDLQGDTPRRVTRGRAGRPPIAI